MLVQLELNSVCLVKYRKEYTIYIRRWRERKHVGAKEKIDG